MNATLRALWAAPVVVAVVCAPFSAGCDVPAEPLPPLPPACDAGAAAEALFVEAVYEPVLSRRCVLCHSAGGMAEGSRLRLDRVDGSLLSALQSVQLVARDSDDDGLPLLLAKPLGRLGHGGGTILEEGSPELEALAAYAAWARGGDDGSCDVESLDRCAESPLGPRLLRRLTPQELDASVQQLLSTTQTPGAALPVDATVGLFANHESRTVSPALADQLRLSAESLAQEVVTSRLAQLAPCAAEASRACAATVVEEQGRRFFRRPLDELERDRYLAVYDAAVADSAGDAAAAFAEGLRWVLTAFLQSPHFLYRAELGVRDDDGAFALTPFETATLVAFTLTGAPPDDALLAAAQNGTLATEAGFAEQVERLAADPRARDVLLRFVLEWLSLDRFDSVAKDGVTYPEFNAALVADMKREWEQVLTGHIDSGSSFADALAATHTRASPRLLELYGLEASGPADASGFADVDLAGTGRGGLLTLGAFLTTHSKPNSSGPVQRGVAVRERLLCQELPPPPPNVDASPPPVDPTTTTRQQFTDHSNDAACKSCHQLIDGIGFGFERFDGIGRLRDREAGVDIDDRGDILGSAFTTVTFHGALELQQALAESNEVDCCWAGSAATSVFGGRPQELGCSLEDELQAQTVRALQLPLREVLPALLQTEHARRRFGGADEEDGPGAVVDPLPPPDPDPPDPVDPDPVDPLPDGVSVTAREQNRWESGACFDGVVANGSAADAAWTADLAIEGTLTTAWNATATPLPSGQVRFEPSEAWNQTIGTGQSAVLFGFCTAF